MMGIWGVSPSAEGIRLTVSLKMVSRKALTSILTIHPQFKSRRALLSVNQSTYQRATSFTTVVQLEQDRTDLFAERGNNTKLYWYIYKLTHRDSHSQEWERLPRWTEENKRLKYTGNYEGTGNLWGTQLGQITHNETEHVQLNIIHETR